MSNLLTVHQNLPALPVDATSDEVRKNLMDMFRDRQAFSEHTWKMLLSVCRSWAAWCKLNNRNGFPQNLKMFAIIFYIFRRAVWQ